MKSFKKEEISMLQIDRAIVHLDIIFRKFLCNLNKCKGICCVEGDSGAPITEEEATQIKELLPLIIERLTDEARRTIEEKGCCIKDFEDELTTTTINVNGPCVFTQYDEKGTAYCVIEKAYEDGLTHFQKPLSCHLYPIRIKKYADFDAVNYHEWEICKDAKVLGNRKSVYVYEFLKDPLIRVYGKEWYEELCIAAGELRKRGGINKY